MGYQLVLICALFAVVSSNLVHWFEQKKENEVDNAASARAAASGSASSSRDESVSAAAGRMQLSVNTQTGDYVLSISGSPWLRSAPVFFTTGGQQYSSAPGGGLKMTSANVIASSDVLGMSTTTTLIYQAPNGDLLDVMFRQYSDMPDAILFGQFFEDEVKGSSVKDKNKVNSGFPAFKITDEMLSTPVGYMSYGGYMFGDTAKAI